MLLLLVLLVLKNTMKILNNDTWWSGGEMQWVPHHYHELVLFWIFHAEYCSLPDEILYNHRNRATGHIFTYSVY